MSTKASYGKIGMFVISTIALLIAGIIVLSSGMLGGKMVLLETYIDESVQGLSVGSPVMQRGVQIGQVKSITFVRNEYNLPYEKKEYSKYRRYVMLVMAVDPSRVPEFSPRDAQARLEQMVTREGLRLKLAAQGITGIMYVEADFLADPSRHRPMEVAWTPRHLYIPSMPSTLTTLTSSLDRILHAVERIDFVGITRELTHAVESLDTAISDVKVAKMREEILRLVADVRSTNQLVMTLLDKTRGAPGAAKKADLADVVQSLQDALQSVQRQVGDAQIAKVRQGLTGLIGEVRETNTVLKALVDKSKADLGAANVPETLTRFNKTLKRMEQMVSGQQSELETIMSNLRQASVNLLRLSESAKKYPSHVLFGTAPPRVEKKK